MIRPWECRDYIPVGLISAEPRATLDDPEYFHIMKVSVMKGTDQDVTEFFICGVLNQVKSLGLVSKTTGWFPFLENLRETAAICRWT